MQRSWGGNKLVLMRNREKASEAEAQGAQERKGRNEGKEIGRGQVL